MISARGQPYKIPGSEFQFFSGLYLICIILRKKESINVYYIILHANTYFPILFYFCTLNARRMYF